MHHCVLQVSVSSLNCYFATFEVFHCTWLSHVNKKLVSYDSDRKNASCPQENYVEFVAQMSFHDLTTVWSLTNVGVFLISFQLVWNRRMFWLATESTPGLTSPTLGR